MKTERSVVGAYWMAAHVVKAAIVVFMLSVWLCSQSGGVFAQVPLTLPAIFDDNMVLQRDTEVTIWGCGAPDAEVTVSFDGQKIRATVAKDGKWKLKLAPMRACHDGRDFIVSCAGNTRTIKNVLVGEVWLASGQSNMGMNLNACEISDTALRTAQFPQIRISGMSKGKDFFIGKERRWLPVNPEMFPDCPAIPFFFARRLQEVLDVPVGIIVRSYGGTAARSWFAPGCLDNKPEFVGKLEQQKASYPSRMKQYEESMAAYEKMQLLYEKDRAEYKAETGRSEHPRPPVRPVVDINSEGGEYYAVNVQPVVPFTVRGLIWDQGEGGSGWEGAETLSEAFQILIASWRRQFENPQMPFLFVQKPSGYASTMDKIGLLPETPEADPSRKYARFIEDMGKMIDTIPHCGMCISADLQEGIHPAAKDRYGKRLADVALASVYGKPIVCYGPLFSGAKVEGNKIRVSFRHIGSGLVSATGSKQVKGFCLAGKDGRYQWADAEIDGSTVVVTSPGISNPVYVRYAWSGHPTWATLFNKEGFPAVIFRTDSEVMPYLNFAYEMSSSKPVPPSGHPVPTSRPR